ncbi:putative bifunctional diguanylate cyclase/phosphodiesterase [Marinicella rhabdoformis]|uniref:putative bifunctional diguanylate cyclase/phosphodiesterase n=1 Tax=Marinicella rhabdoformis TaxID=2580566 RepID=UPI0015D08338|nr:EAL domain-containing protein [Marinicella rhabdoformis]
MSVGVVTLILNAKKYTRCAIYLLLSSLFICTLILCLFLDLPNNVAPRTAHNYFLSIGILSYWLLLGEHKLLRISILMMCLAAFIVFASSLIGFPIDSLETADAEAGRVVGAWINSILATVLVGLVIYVFYSDYSLRTQVEKDLSLALPRNQLELYYQAQVNDVGVVKGAEVLLRWKHPKLGVVLPTEFIPLAEKTGLIVSLGRQVLFKACEQISTWSTEASTAELSLSVNVSVQEINEADFVDNVLATIKQTGIDAAKLKLEITESILIQHAEETIKKIQVLKNHGVTFSLDDFGTGFSSLSYLKALPISQLKIDRSFVSHMTKSRKGAKIVESTILLGQDLGLEVIAEGVETEAQLKFLQSIGCKLFQGYFFSQPVPKTEFENYLEAQIN